MTSKEVYIKGSDGMEYRVVKPYAKEKYKFLEYYMGMFTTSMKTRFELVYIDLFSSNGKCVIEDTGEEINGSALNSLKYPFSKFVFNDFEEDRITELRKRIELYYPDQLEKCQFTVMEADNCLQTIYHSGTIGKKEQLILIFSDPNDLAPSFETIEFISSHLRADLFFHLSYGIDLKRNLKLYLEQKPSKLDRFLGDEDWRSIENITAKDIVDHYFRKLSRLGYQMIDINDEYSRPTMFSIKGQKRIILYYLFVVSKHPLGQRFATEVEKYGNRQTNLFN